MARRRYISLEGRGLRGVRGATGADGIEISSLVGVPAESTNMGDFTSPSVPDNTSVKGAIEGLGGVVDSLDDAVDSLGNMVPYATMDEVEGLPSLADTVSGVTVRGRATVGDGGAGNFSLLSGDFSAEVAADPAGGVFVVPPGKTAAENVLRREYDDGVSARWFTDGIGSDFSIAINRAIAVAVQRGQRVVSIPPGQVNVAQSILMSEAGLIVRGYGRTGGGPTGSSVHKRGATILNWTGGTNDDVFAMNEGSTAIRWGMGIEQLSIQGNRTVGLNGINGNEKTANAIFRDIDMTGIHHGYTCAGDGDCYSMMFDNVGVYDQSGYGWNLPTKNHNVKLIGCQNNFSTGRVPLGMLRAVNGTGITMVGCDVEAGHASAFIRLEGVAAFSIFGGYMEARSADTQQFIRVGENSNPNGRCLGVVVGGVVFHGGGFAREVMMLQSQSSGIVFGDGNQVNGMVGSVINNASPGNNNRTGAFWKTPGLAMFVGGNDGFDGRARTRTTADTPGIAAETAILTTNHFMRDPRAPRTITAKLMYSAADSGTGGNFAARIQRSLDGGSTWSNFGEASRISIPTGGTPIQGMLLVEEEDTAPRDPMTSISYRIAIIPEATTTVNIRLGSTLTIQEHSDQ